MAKRQRLSVLVAGQAILRGVVAVIPKRSCVIAGRFQGRCSNALICMSKCRDCRRRNCGPMRRLVNPATSFVRASFVRAKCNGNALGAAMRILINRKLMRCAGSRRMIRRCWRTRLICCSCRRVRCIAFCGWRGLLLILLVVPTFLGRMWLRRLGIGVGNGRGRRGWREPTPRITSKDYSDPNGTYLSPVIPAKAGIQRLCLVKKA